MQSNAENLDRAMSKEASEKSALIWSQWTANCSKNRKGAKRGGLFSFSDAYDKMRYGDVFGLCEKLEDCVLNKRARPGSECLPPAPALPT